MRVLADLLPGPALLPLMELQEGERRLAPDSAT